MKNLKQILAALLILMMVFACEKNEPTPAGTTVVEKTPEEDTTKEETPAEETPAEETPAEETPSEETPVEETPAEETPAEETPDETPVEETPDETPVEEAPDENQAENPINAELISGKWLIEETGEFFSVELNKNGNYNIVMPVTGTSDEAVFSGTYEITNNNTIVLSNFGTITATNIKENSITYTITLDTAPDSPTTITAIKQI